jgi:hypothetical protein
MTSSFRSDFKILLPLLHWCTYIIPYTLLHTCLLLLDKMIFRCIHVLHVLLVHSFLLLNSISSYGNLTIFFYPFHQLDSFLAFFFSPLNSLQCWGLNPGSSTCQANTLGRKGGRKEEGGRKTTSVE